jgi:thioesterase domain-containing protein
MWSPLAKAGLEVHEVPGTHRTMVFEPHASVLADTLSRRLDEAWARAGTDASGGDKAA